MSKSLLPLSAYPVQRVQPLRYADLDPNNHVNNAATAVLFEVGRTEFIHGEIKHLMRPNGGTVIVKLLIEFHAEILWPGEVTIATAFARIGGSSVTYVQALFQNGLCTTTAEVVAVQIDKATRRPLPFSDEQRAFYPQFLLKTPD
jgi:acyl-CoA thioester hydrolase